MSREIKFRAWVNDHWVDWIPTCKTLGAYNASVIDTDGYTYEKDNPFIVEQYTGIRDKNGKEIYEGDICRLTYYTKKKTNKRWHKDYEDVEVVEFEDGYFKFTNTDQYGIGSELAFSDYGEWSSENGNYKYEAEVIGNIHENPELLEGEE